MDHKVSQVFGDQITVDPSSVEILLDTSLSDSLGNYSGDLRFKSSRDDKSGANLLFRDKFSDTLGSSKLHFSGDSLGSDINGTSEETRENKGVVDLVGEIRSTSGNNVSTSFIGLIGHDFGNGVGQSKDDWLLSHALDHLWLKDSSSGDTDEEMGTLDNLLKRSLFAIGVGNFCQSLLFIVHIDRSILVDSTLGITNNDILDT
mmetsp:Transcript_1373/g.1249  ORF Transcript_1373/g.1249 Transcript_1373/m.1249 type:complete len:203 (-) Transcript_1373:688-1296(-)